MLRLTGAIAIVGILALGVYGGATLLFPSLVFDLAGLGATSNVPSVINHQGVVSINGTRFTGAGSFKFAIVDPDTGNNVWTNDGSQVPDQSGEPTNGIALTVTDGVYNAALGASPMTAISPSLFADGNLVLRVWFNDGTHNWQQLSPDHPLRSVPYAMNVADGAITTAKLAPGIVMPVGTVQAYAFSTAPAGWLLCDGSALAAANSAAGVLRQMLIDAGNPYGSSGGNPLLPDLRGRLPVGLGTHADVDALGDNDGLATGSRRPAHVHTIAGHKHGKGSLAVSGGSHRHNVTLVAGGTVGFSDFTDRAPRMHSYAYSDSATFFTEHGTHTHPNSEFSGVVGLTSGVDGDAGFNSGAAGAGYLTINYIIKY